jgi:hypothetical protein
MLSLGRRVALCSLQLENFFLFPQPSILDPFRSVFFPLALLYF